MFMLSTVAVGRRPGGGKGKVTGMRVLSLSGKSEGNIKIHLSFIILNEIYHVAKCMFSYVGWGGTDTFAGTKTNYYEKNYLFGCICIC